jgi:bacteriorhodopsin
MVWLFSEGFASFSVSFEVCAYAMLDIVSKVIFSFIVMAGNDALASAPDAYNDYK